MADAISSPNRSYSSTLEPHVGEQTQNPPVNSRPNSRPNASQEAPTSGPANAPSHPNSVNSQDGVVQEAKPEHYNDALEATPRAQRASPQSGNAPTSSLLQGLKPPKH